MKSFPMFIRTSGRRVVILGGGEQAAQKMRLILKSDAQIEIAAPALDPELKGVVGAGRAQWHRGGIAPEFFRGAAMGFIATGCPGLDASLHALAQEAGCPVNVVDQPALCDLTTPSIVDRDPVVVAIGSEGTAPVLARQIKTRVEEVLPPTLGGLAAAAGRLRSAVAQQVPRPARRAFWRWVFAGPPRDHWTRGAERDAITTIKQAILKGGAPDTPQEGSVALIGAGPGARDLLTLRAVARLQEADVIFYDRLVDPEVLELARRDAERVYVGKVVGAHAWPQEQINALIVAEALKGKQVVRLKSGDPGVFGRGGEEIAAAEARGISVEIVPGVTAACAAAACAGISLTERGVTNSLVLATGTGADGEMPHLSDHLSGPGTTTAFYMATRQAAQISAALRVRGVPQDLEFTLAVDVSKPGQRILTGPIRQLDQVIRDHGVTGCAVILLRWPVSVQRQPLPSGQIDVAPVALVS
ncbi:uroporphyrinogen-III C-methyltransferase [Roseobacter cerasinus]|uniref:Uroporphyrinogen-III C-methyltransferase n=1 Tax=Roseobacter cerasinus TaxID=2602289 RepID=A0A640VKM9_9RHOB|nr:siroheme synthase CysG [Roseobacter cerasinus]GFE48863.1 uroporphyrinogen-III C-methyltransferase [Roseobacter cerasinus]